MRKCLSALLPGIIKPTSNTVKMLRKSVNESVSSANKKWWTWCIFIAYLLILTKLTLFKLPAQYMDGLYENFHIGILKYSIMRAQLIPFTTIKHYLFEEIKPWEAVANLFGNVLMFLPAGVLLHRLFPSRINTLFKATLASFFLSMMFELIQIVTVLGLFDVDDLLLNTIGGLLGYKLYTLQKKYHRHAS